MNQKQISVARVSSFDARDSAAAALLLDDGTSVRLSKADARFEVWTQIVELARSSGRPIYAELDSNRGEVTQLLLPSVRKVEFVAERPEGERLKVALFAAPSLYFARTNRPDFELLEKMLRASAARGVELLLSVDPSTLEILDARPV